MGAMSTRKGSRIERELVQLHRDIGVHCERYPLSGASRFRGSGHDLDIDARGKEEAPFLLRLRRARTAMALPH
jgi:Holliday junction resolvase